MNINIKLLDGGIMPKKAHPNDACFDCFADVNTIINGHTTMTIPLGFCLELPIGYEAQIRPRSGLAAKKGIEIILGTIDSDYRGEVRAIVKNVKDTPYLVDVGDKIAQMAICPVLDINFKPVDILTDSVRGSNGFGSTGK